MAKSGPVKIFRDRTTFPVSLERRDVLLLRALAQRRQRGIGDMIRERLEGLLAEAEGIFGRSIPGGGETNERS